jgi:hypothetical protein
MAGISSSRCAIIAVESAYDVGARSRAGGIGLMQLMPATARELGVDPTIPERNIAGGVRYFSVTLDISIDQNCPFSTDAPPRGARRAAASPTGLFTQAPRREPFCLDSRNPRIDTPARSVHVRRIHWPDKRSRSKTPTWYAGCSYLEYTTSVRIR